MDYPKVRIEYRKGRWRIVSNASEGRGCEALEKALLTLTPWEILPAISS